MIFKNYILNLINYIISLKGWKNLLSIDSLLKICFMYMVITISIIFFYFEIPDGPFDKKEPYKRISVYSNIDRMGEHQIYKRTMFGCANLKEYKCLGIGLPQTFINYKLTKHFFVNAVNLANAIFKPDFNLLTTHFVTILPRGYNVFYINVPYDMIIGLDNKFKEYVSFLKDADAFLDLNLYSTGNKYFLEEAIQNAKSKAPIIPGILIIQNNQYSFAEPKDLVLTGSLWGCSRGSLRVSEMLRRFGNEGRLYSYGPKEYLGHLEGGYVNDRSFHKISNEDIIPLHKKHGISIVVHNFDHIIGEVPTTRISESIASGSIVISDQHPFIKKHFGDNILYFDAFASVDDMYKQVRDHMEWIKNNPEAVKEKTRVAHEILMKNFSSEVQLPKIYEEVMSLRGNLQ